jgi:hypothetical protein
MGLGWPLIGRAEELDVIASAIGKSSASAGVVIFGNLGVGKSRLAYDAASRCNGAVVPRAAGSSAARAIPLGAFVNWLPAEIPDSVHAAGTVVNELMKGAGPRPASSWSMTSIRSMTRRRSCSSSTPDWHAWS